MKKTNIIIIFVVLLFCLPAFLSHSLVNAVNQMLIAALFACAFNLVCGQGGMLSFGHSAYFGIGAFATLHAMGVMGAEGIMPTPFLPVAGALVGFSVGLIAGWFSTKRTGVYFSMITLALAELLHTVAPHLKGIFGGEAGLSGMRMPSLGISFGTDIHVYYLTLIWVLLAVGFLYFLTFTPFGRLVFALRDNSHRLRFLGYNVHRLGTMTFALSAMFAGLAGGLQVISIEASNYTVFDMHLSAEVVLNTYIGGVNVFIGPLLGAAVMTFMGNAFSDLTRNWLLYKGVIFILFMMFMPTGIVGFFQILFTIFRKYSLRILSPFLLLASIAALLLGFSTVYTVEMMQRVLSQDYQMLAQLAGANVWPAIVLFGREWFPGTGLFYVVPVFLFFSGLAALKLAIIKWHKIKDNDESGVSGATLPEKSGNDVSEQNCEFNAGEKV